MVLKYQERFYESTVQVCAVDKTCDHNVRSRWALIEVTTKLILREKNTTPDTLYLNTKISMVPQMALMKS